MLLKNLRNKLSISNIRQKMSIAGLIDKKNLKHAIIALVASLTSLLFFYVFQHWIFTNMIIEFLLFYSVANFILAITTFGLIYFVFRGERFINLQDTFTIFLFYFFFANEVCLTLIIYDKIRFLGIYVPIGDCPWKGIRLAFTFVFLSTFLSLSLSFNKISAYINKQIKK
jgi:hypothetical protein